MFKKECRCKKTQKNFKIDIGEFFINECCEKAGFDNLGNREEKPKEKEIIKKVEELDKKLDAIEKEKKPKKKKVAKK